MKDTSPEKIPLEESYYFALQSSWGLTKHMGGLRATEELIELCHVNENSYVLDAGCGVGITSCYLAKKYGCKVIAVDVSEDMIKQAKKRAERKGVGDKIDFIVADVTSLPFKDNFFDAVISESVNAFIKDKRKAISEYRRVAKQGGYVGFNEATWIKMPPPELVEYLSNALGGAEFLTPDGWKNLLEEAKFSDIVVRLYKTSAWRQWADEVKQMDFKDFLTAWGKFLVLLLKSREARKYVIEISKPPKSIFRIFKYWGYGIYVGRK